MAPCFRVPAGKQRRKKKKPPCRCLTFHPESNEVESPRDNFGPSSSPNFPCSWSFPTLGPRTSMHGILVVLLHGQYITTRPSNIVTSTAHPRLSLPPLLPHSIELFYYVFVASSNRVFLHEIRWPRHRVKEGSRAATKVNIKKRLDERTLLHSSLPPRPPPSCHAMRLLRKPRLCFT